MHIRSFARFACALPAAAALLALPGCGNSGSKPAPTPAATAPKTQKSGPVVAKVGPEVITADEVRAKLAEQSPFLQARYRDLNHKKEFVQNLVRFEVLAQEAYRRGLHETPEVQATIKKVLVQELIRQAFDEKQAVFTDEELKAYYDKHIDEFVKPERVRAQHLFLAAPESDKAARAQAKKKAGELLAQLKANEAKAPLNHPQHASYSTTLFAELAKANTNDLATQATGGDLRYLSQEDMTRQYSQAFADAVFKLKSPNDLSALIETPSGFHIARLTNRQLPVNRSFDDPQVRETIKGRLFREQRTKSFDEYVEQLKKDAGVTIDEAVLATVEVQNAANPPPFGAPPPPPAMLNPNPAPAAPVAGTPAER